MNWKVLAVGGLAAFGVGCGTANYHGKRLVYGMNAELFEPECAYGGSGLQQTDENQKYQDTGTGGTAEAEPIPLGPGGANSSGSVPSCSSPPQPGGWPGTRIIIEREFVLGG